MAIELGLFDIHQIDPTDGDDHGQVYARRLDDLTLADELGLSVAFTAERHFLANYRCPAPSVWLAAAAQRTQRLRLGVMAYTLPIHAPARLAEEVAVLDHLSGGRIEVGLGLGHRPEELAALGVAPAERITIFQERLAILQALWSGGQVTIESAHDTLREVAINPRPLQEPHPPLWYAGGSPVAARWAGTFGLSLAVGFAPTRDLLPATTAFREGCAARREQREKRGAAPGEGRIALMRHVYIAESDERARDELIDALLRVEDVQRQGGTGSRSDRRAAAGEEVDKLVRDEVYVAGGPETVARGIDGARRALGADLFLANPYSAGSEDEQVRRSLSLLAGDVHRLVNGLTSSSA